MEGEQNKDNETPVVEEEKTGLDRFGWDTKQWLEFVNEAKHKKIEEARLIYREFLSVFPTAVRYWCNFINQEIEAKNYPEVDLLFNECLLKVPHVTLWQCYLDYCRLTSKNRENGNKILAQAYEYAVSNIKFDVNATPIWKDYLQFLQEHRTSESIEEENLRATKIRETYEQAVVIPLANSSEIWDRYVAYNNSFKSFKITTHKKRYSAHSQSIVLYRERKNLDDSIPTIPLAVPPGQGNPEHEKTAVKYWKKIIEFEKRNPQKLSPLQLREQVVYTYKQCLLTLLHYPEIWYDYAKFYSREGLPEEALRVYKQSIEYLPECTLLHFAYADYLEDLNRPQEAEEIYEKLIKIKNETLVWIQRMCFTQRVYGIKKARKVFLEATKQASITYHIYVASAMMELYHNKDPALSQKIFNRAYSRKNIASETDFLVLYLKFLWNLNEAQNTRLMFENVLAAIPPEKSKVIWNLYLEFEYECGDAKTVSHLEKRKADKFPNEDTNGILALVNRHRYKDLWPCDLPTLDSFEVEGKEKDVEDTQSKIQEELATKYPRPDFSNMLPYREQMAALTPNMFGPAVPPPNGGEVVVETNPIDDTYSNLPDPLVDFISRLPSTHEGPIPDVDQVLKAIQEVNLPPLQDASVALGKRRGNDVANEKPTAKKHKANTDAWRRRQGAAKGKSR